MQFVWSDDLAGMLVDAAKASPADLADWRTRIVGYRLPPEQSPLEFALELWEAQQHHRGDSRRAS